MDGRLLLLVLAVFSPVLAVPYCEGDKDDKDDMDCPKCHPVRPMRDFDEEKFLGTWYQTRWYVPKKFTVSDELFDMTHIYFKKEGEPRTLYYNIDCSQKNKMYCDPTMFEKMTEIRAGQYWTSQGPWADNFTTNVLYTDYDKFAVLHICVHADGNAGDCVDEELTFWSRTDKMTLEQTKKGQKIAKMICYWDQLRYTDTKHRMDCTPWTEEKCKKMKKKC